MTKDSEAIRGELRKISANISPEFEQFVCDELAAGKYKSPEGVVSEGLGTLGDLQFEALRKEIDVGFDEIDRDEIIDSDDARAHEAMLEDIKARGDNVLARAVIAMTPYSTGHKTELDLDAILDNIAKH